MLNLAPFLVFMLSLESWPAAAASYFIGRCERFISLVIYLSWKENKAVSNMSDNSLKKTIKVVSHCL